MTHITKHLKKVVHFIGASVKEGQNHYEGAELAPDIIRNSGLMNSIKDLGWLIEDHGDIGPFQFKNNHYGPDYAKSIYNINLLGDLMQSIHKKVKLAASRKGFVVTCGGDHSVATGTISGLKQVYPNLKVLWVDAHADCVVPEFNETRYRNYHGMPVSHLMGWLSKESTPNFDWMPRNVLKPSDICYIGIRDLEQDEKYHIKNFGIKHFTPDHITKLGIGEVMERALHHLGADKNPIHISFDVDGIDPLYAPGTGTKVREGLSYNEAMYICRRACATRSLVSLDCVEINPSLEPKDDKAEKLFGDSKHLHGTKTVLLGCELILSCLGRKAMSFIDTDQVIKQDNNPSFI